MRLVLGKNDVLALLYFVKKFVGYMYAREAFVDMDIFMDIHGYIYRYIRKICGYKYEYGWEISYPRQAWICCDL